MPDVTFKAGDGARLPCLPGDDRTEYIERASGLRLRVTRSDARAWLVAYWSPTAKTARRLKLGDGARMPLSEAHRAARAALHAVEQEARDPAAERAAAGRQEREERARRAEDRRRVTATRRRRGVTFGKVCRDYVEHRRTTASGRFNRPARPNTLAAWAGTLDNYILPALKDRPVVDVTSEDFLRVLEDAVKRGGPSMGPRTRELLAAVWRWIEQRPGGLGVTLPAVSPLLRLPKVGAAQTERDRALSPAEVWRLWQATEGEGAEGAALRLMLLTAARVREVTDLRSSELDLGPAAVWRLPAVRSKGGRERAIPLSPQALALLRGTPSSADGRLFPERVSEATLARIRAAMGGEHWQTRDLRRTAATLCARLGADPFVVSLVLGHARPDARMPAVTGAYLRWNYADKVREALDRLGAWIADTTARKREPGDVVSIRAQR